MRFPNKSSREELNAKGRRQKTVVIVGASDGIGESLAYHYKEVLGRNVLALARSHRMVNAGSPIDFQVDISTGNGLAEAAESVRNNDCLIVVTAGTIGNRGPILELDQMDWNSVLNINLLGPLRVYREFADCVLASSKVVFFSGGGVGGPTHQNGAGQYVISKTALVALVEELAAETNPEFPSLCAVSPGKHSTFFGGKTSWSRPADQIRRNAESLELLRLDKLIRILDFVEKSDRHVIHGRLFSANWDEPDEVLRILKVSGGHDFGRLRRLSSP